MVRIHLPPAVSLVRTSLPRSGRQNCEARRPARWPRYGEAFVTPTLPGRNARLTLLEEVSAPGRPGYLCAQGECRPADAKSLPLRLERDCGLGALLLEEGTLMEIEPLVVNEKHFARLSATAEGGSCLKTILKRRLPNLSAQKELRAAQRPAFCRRKAWLA